MRPTPDASSDARLLGPEQDEAPHPPAANGRGGAAIVALPGRTAEDGRRRPALPSPAAGAELPRLLVVDHDDAGFELVRARLREGLGAELAVERAHSVESALRRLGDGGIDVCLVEQCLPGRPGLDLARIAAERGLDVPTILLAGAPGAELEHAAVARGVADLLEKDRLEAARLARSIRFALARATDARRLVRLAQYDELTGLASRVLFQDRLLLALAAARRQGRLVAVMVLDLNGFKPINDRLGHAAGDELLCVMGRRLRARLRATDTVARLGGDEFGVVVDGLAKPEHAALVARKLLDAVAPPATVDGVAVRVSASLGVALYPRDGEGPDVLKRLADAAMYRAKAEGGHLCRFHDPRTESRLHRGALLECDLRRGLEQGELVLHYQPQVTLRAGGLGLAAMPRWHHAELGLVGPDRFLGLAEDVGLLELLSDWAVGAACEQARRWQEDGLGNLHVALPILSRRQLAWSDLPARLQGWLTAHRLAPATLELEIDEALWLAEVERGGETLRTLKEIGVRLALGGFGESASSLRGLEPEGLDSLKLGRRLLQGLPGDRRRAALVKAVIDLAHDLGLRVVAEGVDRPAQLAFLRREGCDAVQTLLSAPALPADACAAWLAQARARG